VCRGTILSRAQYLVDIDRWVTSIRGWRRRATSRSERAAIWTAGITEDGPRDAIGEAA